MISHKQLSIHCDKMSNKVMHDDDSLVIGLESHDKDFLTSKGDSKRGKERDTHDDVNYSASNGDIAMKGKIKDWELESHDKDFLTSMEDGKIGKERDTHDYINYSANNGDIAMKRKIKELERRNCNLVKSNKQLKESLAYVKQDLKTKERDFEREKNKQLRDKLHIEETLSKKLRNITDDKRKFQKQCEDLAEKNLKLSEDNKKLDLEKKELKTELNCLHSSFDSKELRIEQLIKEMAQLDLQLKELGDAKKKEERDKHYYYIQLQKERKAKKTQNLEDSIVPLSSDLQNQTICSTATQPLKDQDETRLLSAAISHVKSSNSQAAKVQEIYTLNKKIISERMWQITNRNKMPHQNINQQKLSEFVLGIQSGSDHDKIFFQNVVRPKLTWIRQLLSGKKDMILIQFIDSVLNLKL